MVERPSSNGPPRRATLEPKTPSPPSSCNDQNYGGPHGDDLSRPPTPHQITSLPTAADLPMCYPICICNCIFHFHFPIATYKKSCHGHPASAHTHPSIAYASVSVALSSSSQQRGNFERPNHARCQSTMQRTWCWFGPLNLRFSIRARFAASSSKNKE